MILAIDTSTEQASLALSNGGEVLAELSWKAGRNHSRQLTNAIDGLLSMASRAIDDVHAVSVASGPGSFSGIRVGMSEAKGLAMALGVPLVGVNTLDLIAHQCRTTAPEVWCVISAGRNDVATANYKLLESGPQRQTDYFLIAVRQLVDRITAPAHIAGPASADVSAALGNQTGISFEEGASRIRRAAFLAELGEKYLDSGGKDQLFELEPLYLRLSAAEEAARR